MAYRINFGPLMSGGDRVVTINGKDTGHYLSNGFFGAVHFFGPDIDPPRGKMSYPFDSVSAAKTALLRALIKNRGNVAAAFQAAACPNA